MKFIPFMTGAGLKISSVSLLSLKKSKLVISKLLKPDFEILYRIYIYVNMPTEILKSRLKITSRSC